MTINNGANSSNQAKQKQIVRRQPRRSPVTMTIVTAGLILGILAVLLLPVENWAAAAPPENELCAMCNYTADAARYTGLAALHTAGRAASTARLGGLAEFHAERAGAGVAASTARYTGLAALHTAGRAAGTARLGGPIKFHAE